MNDDGNWATPASEPVNFIEVNMTTKKGKREVVTKVGLIGSFCGWSDDDEVSFEYDDVNNVWETPVVTFAAGDTFLVRLNGKWDGECKYGTATAKSTAIPDGYELENGATAADIKAPGAGDYIVRLYANRTPLVIMFIAQ